MYKHISVVCMYSYIIILLCQQSMHMPLSASFAERELAVKVYIVTVTAMPCMDPTCATPK